MQRIETSIFRLGFFACLLLMAACVGPAHAEESSDRLQVDANKQTIILKLPKGLDQTIRIYALSPYEKIDPSQKPVYSGDAQREIKLPRDPKRSDLLYKQFVVCDENNKPILESAWVSRVDDLPVLNHAMPWPEQIKGVSNPEDLDDLVALGVRHVHVNFILRTLLLPEQANDPPAEFIREVNGHRVRFNPNTIKRWDAKLKRMTDDGINVVAVLLNGLAANASNDDMLVHPDTDIPATPHKLAAFNIDSDQAVAAYTGAIGFLAERYSRPDKKHGWIGGYIVGNEVDSHWVWHNMGPADLEKVAAHYMQEVRLAWLAVREQASSPRVFISLTHSWARPNAMDPLRSLAGKDLLIRLTELSRSQGDFGWEVAYHPYPQNLFQPRFWEDRMAMFGYDSPMITFKNIELLPAYLDRPEMHFAGQPRRVILSEQGLHTPKGPGGEKIQAAALALAMHRAKQTSSIDAFILHRHIDSRHEGGLLLGLRHPPDLATKRLGGKKQSWHVFQQFETPQWEEKARFALDVAGYTSWEEAEPKRGPFPEKAPEWGDAKQHASVLIDLVKTLKDAEVDHALAVRQKIVNLPDGGFVEAIMLHPKRAGSPNVTAVFKVELPKNSKPEFRFKTYREKAKGDGVVFRVRIDDKIVFEQTVEDQTMRAERVDLSKHAGKTIKLTLEVGPRKNSNYDSALWLAPAIVDSK